MMYDDFAAAYGSEIAQSLGRKRLRTKKLLGKKESYEW